MSAAMRAAAAVLAAALSAQAQAHLCDGFSAAGPESIEVRSTDWDTLPCLPRWVDSQGTAEGYSLQLSAAGAVAWVWCPGSAGWQLRWGVGTWADLADAAPELPAALLSEDPRAALKALGSTHLSLSLTDPELKALWCPHWQAMRDSKPVSWVVAPAAANANPPGTRPAYPWTGAARGSVSNGRATQGTMCNPRVGRLEGSTAYYGVNGRADQVAVCVRAP
jgi:hypothetical protein